MCGISALYRYTTIDNEDISKLRLMNEEMNYRGPDENGVWSDEKCGMAHTRLSIIGLENGIQPIFNEDNTVIIICNGEIYNYIELREQLIQKGHTFYTDSDTEVIVHLYEDYGLLCVDYLRGMFAFCLWDKKLGQLVAVRDRIGEKSLYFSEIPSGVIFSTELKAILKYFIKQPDLNLGSLLESVEYSYPQSLNKTFVEQINRVEPGQYIVVNKYGIKKKIYWKINNVKQNSLPFDEIVKTTQGLIRESVKLNLRSDVPVAVLLSSGIDSSAIAAFAKETMPNVETITIGYKGMSKYELDERELAKRFAKDINLPWNEVEIDAKDYLEAFEEYSSFIDEPVCDIAAIAQWCLYKKAKELGFKVLISGNGADEIFYGYDQHNATGEKLILAQLHRKLLPANSLKEKRNIIKFIVSNWQFLAKAQFSKALETDVLPDYFKEHFEKFVNSEYEDKSINGYIASNKAKGDLNGIDQIYSTLFKTWLPGNCLYLSDRLGMGTSIEIRSPFVDYKLVEYISSLPLEMKYRSNTSKFLLKKSLEGVLPEYIINRPKKGFAQPIALVDTIIDNYKNKYFKGQYKYYNSILTDRIISKLFAENLQ
ncbi:asparagine synthase (glutamine-hydrolyzing) [Spirosoma aerolatum]|uniref:asparagine synthase (glutamine-hydrolyzing) n=1 Tax=Spirosoma aerolatum TaxID=1211326 RepID=UPI0009ACC64F|nr:asparagine synthase (glutamine-hydrolyzing) [Spirosoma aerolatum]